MNNIAKILIKYLDLLSISNNYEELDTNRQKSLINQLTIIGVTLLAIFGINSYFNDVYWLSFTLMLFSAIGLINLAWYKKSRNYKQASQILSFSIVLLALVLISTGGTENTGILWIYPLIPVIIFISGFAIGTLFVGHLLISSMLILYIPDNPLLIAEYSPEMTFRFIVTLIVLSIFCIAYESTRFMFQRKVAFLHQELSEAANTDSLTLLCNRRYIHEHTIKDNKFDPNVVPSGVVIMADIDHFKQFNDRYGHDAGDQVLKNVALCLVDNVRSGDIVSRWGGEEFLIILPNAPIEAAYMRADLLRKKISEMKIHLSDEDINLTMSFGIATITDNQPANETIKQADDNLYTAKQNGRNKII